jgi:flagellar hook-basal body complex protein FliE
MTPVSGISSIPLPESITPSGVSDPAGAFSSVLKTAIGSIQGLQDNADSTVQKFLTGENDDLHTTVLATQRAEMSFELGLQVRNKVISAYQEIMKMQL